MFYLPGIFRRLVPISVYNLVSVGLFPTSPQYLTQAHCLLRLIPFCFCLLQGSSVINIERF